MESELMKDVSFYVGIGTKLCSGRPRKESPSRLTRAATKKQGTLADYWHTFSPYPSWNLHIKREFKE
ncbi:hypothetical protein FRX31_027125 [Thalictrum thalictroides]|uniref:Uncharacterized protein n=1 Tax=Thalictrum thalictroides TaxID=46969 RepID=A0A7J6VFA5_THATH|nr:hypothetical protein FRX31_027125 [Thalictrum thalictroides]